MGMKCREDLEAAGERSFGLVLSVVPPVVLPVVLLAACRVSWLSFKGGATSGCCPAIGSAEHPFSSCVRPRTSIYLCTAAAVRYLSYHLNLIWAGTNIYWLFLVATTSPLLFYYDAYSVRGAHSNRCP